MRAFGKIFWLEMTALVRSRTLAMLVVAAVVWMGALPHLVLGDGTAEGARELWIRYSLGGVFALLVLSLLASATGSIAREREAKRLPLTLVRPVSGVVIVLAKAAALTLAGAVVLAIACAILPFSARTDLSRPCRHVLTPVLPSARTEAKAMYEAYMRDPETPEAVRKAKPGIVLRLLENRAIDHYFTVETNATGRWRFDLPGALPDDLRVRVRFAGICDSRRDVRGVFRLGSREGVVSNVTQLALEVPLRPGTEASAADGGAEPRWLAFENRGREALLLRPRRDVELLVPADAFGWNLLRAYVEMVGVLALVVSFGLFLSAAFSRPVALFVALVTLTVGEMSPSVLSQCPDELEAGAADRIGLALTRVAAEVTRPVTALDPVARLATDVCIERREAVRVTLLDFLTLPLVLALLSAGVRFLRR